MKRALKLAGLSLGVALVAIQFFRPERNAARVDPAEDLLWLSSPPDPVAALIRNTCYDCHSNQTDYPWYSHIAPVSWYLHKHIAEGKKELNVSHFGSLGKAEKIELLVDVCEVVEDGTMPLTSYKLLHRSARLSEEEKEAICKWSEEEALKVMRE